MNCMKNMKNIKTLTITHSRDKIIFVAENGTENHRATSDKEEGVETDSP